MSDLYVIKTVRDYSGGCVLVLASSPAEARAIHWAQYFNPGGRGDYHAYDPDSTRVDLESIYSDHFGAPELLDAENATRRVVLDETYFD